MMSDEEAKAKRLAEAAARALAEAQARRDAESGGATAAPTEIGGRADGPDPTRYGDWEKKGVAVDF